MYCTKLNLQVPDFSSDLPRIEKPDWPKHVQFRAKIPDSVLETLSSVGMKTVGCSYFYISPGMRIPMHADGIGVGVEALYPKNFQVAKLNFIIGGEGSIMKWWEHNGGSAPLDLTSHGSTPYKKYPESECSVVHEQHLQGAWLVNGGILHSVDSPTVRHCISYALGFSATNRIADYREAREVFMSKGFVARGWI